MSETSHKIRVYIAEEDEIFRHAYMNILAERPGIDVVGCSGQTEGEIFVASILEKQPDVILLGIKVLVSTTIETMIRIAEKVPKVSFVVLLGFIQGDIARALNGFTKLAPGGHAIFLKPNIASIDDLIQVILSVVRGKTLLDSAVLEHLQADVTSPAYTLGGLTRRELEILGWMAKGYKNSTIAELLFLDPKSVEGHINSIYFKISSESSKHPRVEAITLYLRGTGQLKEAESVQTLVRYPSVATPQPSDLSADAQATFSFFADLRKVHLDDYKVIGAFVSSSEKLKYTVGRLLDRLGSLNERAPINIFLCAEPGSGKTFFVRQVASELRTNVEFVYTKLSNYGDIATGVEEHLCR